MAQWNFKTFKNNDFSFVKWLIRVCRQHFTAKWTNWPTLGTNNLKVSPKLGSSSSDDMATGWKIASCNWFGLSPKRRFHSKTKSLLWTRCFTFGTIVIHRWTISNKMVAVGKNPCFNAFIIMILNKTPVFIVWWQWTF